MPSESESFLGLQPSPDGNPSAPDSDRPRGRFTLLAVTWLIALAAASPDPRGIVMLLYFPLGLLKVFSTKPEGSEGGIILGWLVYGFLSSCVLLIHRKFWFYLVYAVLVVMLLTNVAGCHMIMDDMSGIH